MVDTAAPSDPPAPALPRTPDEIVVAAGALGFAVPDACMAGVVANLALLDGHAATLVGAAAPGGR